MEIAALTPTRMLSRSLVVFVLLTARSNPVGVRNLHIEELVSASDAVVVAEVGDAKDLGRGQPILFRDHLLEAEAYSTELRLRRTLKGSPPGRITVRYTLPTTFVGYRGLHRGVRLVALKHVQDAYELADPYYPDFPAVTEPPRSAGADYTRAVILEMLAVIASPTASLAEKSEILRVDYALPKNQEVIGAFREGLTSAHTTEMRQRLLGELIRFGDVDRLPEVAQLLLSNSAIESQRDWLLYVIANQLNSERAIPALQPLLKSDDSTIRGAAAKALWHIATPAAVPNLADALQDSDEQVRFYAVRGFADIANQANWGGPSESEFQENEQKYLSHWQEWAKAQMRP